jgi:hypothetical protein
MTDYALRFPDEATGRALLGSALNANRTTEDGSLALACFTATHALDLIGAIDGAIGWHANVRLLTDAELPAELTPYLIVPAHPVRVWA